MEAVARRQPLLTCRVVPRLADIDAASWDALGVGHPFLRHAFLSALEESGAVAADTGWLPRHLAIDDPAGGLAAAMPLYVKSHSFGEYVFDGTAGRHCQFLRHANRSRHRRREQIVERSRPDSAQHVLLLDRGRADVVSDEVIGAEQIGECWTNVHLGSLLAVTARLSWFPRCHGCLRAFPRERISPSASRRADFFPALPHPVGPFA